MWFSILFGMSIVTLPAVTREARNEVFPCSRVNSLDEFRCQNGTGCISVEHLCDGVPHCSDASDEEFCPHRRSGLTEDWISYRRKRQSTCRSNQWQCSDGSCILVDNICNGVDDCHDGSDETLTFCKKAPTTNSSGCELPPYPTHGTYEVANVPNAHPGQVLDSFVLIVRCRRGFGIVDPHGGEWSGMQQLYCVNGHKQYEAMPRCVRFCKLNPDPSVIYMCHVPGVGFKTCKNYVAPGTTVNPVCNTPLYDSTESFPYMKCNYGYWDNIVYCKPECGRVTPVGSELVIDGKAAKRGELPWHVGIYRKTTKQYLQICGGSLITNNVVLSAAHCFWSDLKKILPASDFAVAIGKIYRDWDSENDIGAQKSDLLEIRIPTRFRGSGANFQEDIAALILKTPFIYMTYVRPVCVYYDANFERIQLRPGNSGKVAGWGLTSAQGATTNILQVIEMPFIDVDACIDTLPESFTEFITGDKFCAGYTTGKALCKGDSGGGLSFPDRGLGVNRYYLRGIVSAAPKDAGKFCNDNAYTTFTMITKHRDFIQEALTASAVKRCSQYSFQCDDGSCVDQGSDCNGIQDCADGSDESDVLCNPMGIPDVKPTTLPPPKPGYCILPPYPDHGTYEVSGLQSARPGQLFDNFVLTVSCQRGYGLLEPDGGLDGNGTQTIYCVAGIIYKAMPECVQFCRLDPNPSVRYMCQIPETTVVNTCKHYVAPRTIVNPVCNIPNYYSSEILQYMNCVNGSWDYIAQCKPECGRVTPEGMPLIIGGRLAKRGELPWHAGIYRKTSKPFLQICGGSLVSNVIVISAANCFWTDFDKKKPESDYAVAVGKLYRPWDDERDVDVQKSDVKEIKISPLFHGAEANFQEDIAIVVLVTPFVYKTYVRPVCLNFDTNFEERQLVPNQLGKLAGWGLTEENGKPSPVLKLVELPYINIDICIKTFPPFFREYITGDKICAGYTNGTALCRGDSGGGLAFPAMELGVDRYYLRGIVSIALSSENLCNAHTYTLFTKITKFVDLIRSIPRNHF